MIIATELATNAIIQSNDKCDNLICLDRFDYGKKIAIFERELTIMA
jgi:hypothetical protein